MTDSQRACCLRITVTDRMKGWGDMSASNFLRPRIAREHRHLAQDPVEQFVRGGGERPSRFHEQSRFCALKQGMIEGYDGEFLRIEFAIRSELADQRHAVAMRDESFEGRQRIAGERRADLDVL